MLWGLSFCPNNVTHTHSLTHTHTNTHTPVVEQVHIPMQSCCIVMCRVCVYVCVCVCVRVCERERWGRRGGGGFRARARASSPLWRCALPAAHSCCCGTVVIWSGVEPRCTDTDSPAGHRRKNRGGGHGHRVELKPLEKCVESVTSVTPSPQLPPAGKKFVKLRSEPHSGGGAIRKKKGPHARS